MIAVCTTLATYAMASEDTSLSWLRNAEAMIESHPEGVQFFAAIQVDARGIEPFAPLLDRLAEVGGEHWTYSLDDGRERIDQASRLPHICLGQNICTEKAVRDGASHMLFLAADLEPPPDCIPRLLEVDWPLVGGHVSTYVLDGPKVTTSHLTRINADVREHMATASFVLIQREVFNRLRWRWDRELNMSDDPSYHYDALHLLGIPTWVRHDVQGRHFPEAIGAVEGRYADGRDMRVYR